MHGLEVIKAINEGAAFRSREKTAAEQRRLESPEVQKRQRVVESQRKAKFSRGS